MQELGVQLEGTERVLTSAATVPLDESPTAEGGVFRRTPAALPPAFAALADFAATGTDASGEFRCADCGYGAVVHRALPPCPMCGGTVWESRAPRSVD